MLIARLTCKSLGISYRWKETLEKNSHSLCSQHKLFRISLPASLHSLCCNSFCDRCQNNTKHHAKYDAGQITKSIIECCKRQFKDDVNIHIHIICTHIAAIAVIYIVARRPRLAYLHIWLYLLKLIVDRYTMNYGTLGRTYRYLSLTLNLLSLAALSL